jgi:hypothetical protein
MLTLESSTVGTIAYVAQARSGATDPNPGDNIASAIVAVVAQPSVGPTVIQVRRIADTRKGSQFVLAFDQSLDGSSVQNLANYTLVAPGPDGRFGTRDDRRQPLASAVYNASTRTVVLTTRFRLPRNQRLQLTATGISRGQFRAILNGSRVVSQS